MCINAVVCHRGNEDPKMQGLLLRETEFVAVASADDRVITVDGIVPPNKGWKTKMFLTISNM